MKNKFTLSLPIPLCSSKMWEILHILYCHQKTLNRPCKKKNLESGPADVGSTIIFCVCVFFLNLALEHNMIGQLELDTMLYGCQSKVLFTRHCRRQNFHPSLLHLVDRLYTLIHKTQKTRTKILPYATIVLQIKYFETRTFPFNSALSITQRVLVVFVSPLFEIV